MNLAQLRINLLIVSIVFLSGLLTAGVITFTYFAAVKHYPGGNNSTYTIFRRLKPPPPHAVYNT